MSLADSVTVTGPLFHSEHPLGLQLTVVWGGVVSGPGPGGPCPMTSCTVLTTVPDAARGASQSRNPVSVVLLTE